MEGRDSILKPKIGSTQCGLGTSQTKPKYDKEITHLSNHQKDFKLQIQNMKCKTREKGIQEEEEKQYPSHH